METGVLVNEEVADGSDKDAYCTLRVRGYGCGDGRVSMEVAITAAISGFISRRISAKTTLEAGAATDRLVFIGGPVDTLLGCARVVGDALLFNGPTTEESLRIKGIVEVSRGTDESICIAPKFSSILAVEMLDESLCTRVVPPDAIFIGVL